MSIGRRVLQSSSLLLTARLLQRGLGLISTLVLVRVLLPTDFGVIAVAALVVYFSEILSDSGCRQYIVQCRHVDSEVLNTAWTVDVLLKALATVLVLACLPFVQWMWQSVAITSAVGGLVPVVLIRALMNPQLHLEVRELDYRNVFAIEIAQKLVGFIAVIAFAFLLKSYWAMVVGSYVSVVFALVMSYRRCEYRPRPTLRHAREQWRFSKWVLSSGYLGYMRANIDIMLLARFFPIAPFGRFSVARELTLAPTEIIGPATTPLLAAMSRVREDRPALALQVRTAVLAIVLVVAPICTFLFAYHESVVALLLGTQWLDAAALMQALTLVLFGFALGSLVNHLLIAEGRVKYLFFYDLGSLIAITTVILLAAELPMEPLVWVRSVFGMLIPIVMLGFLIARIGPGLLRATMHVCVPFTIGALATLSLPDVDSKSPWTVIPIAVAFAMSYCIATGLVALVARRLDPSWEWLFALTLDLFDRQLRQSRTNDRRPSLLAGSGDPSVDGRR